MGSEYLASSKSAKFDEVEAKIQGVSIIYNRIEQLCGDPNPLRKKVADYRSIVSTFLLLKKAAFTCRHPNDVEKENALYAQEVNLARPGKTDPRPENQTERPGPIPDPTPEICSPKSGPEIRIDMNRTIPDPKFFTKLLLLA